VAAPEVVAALAGEPLVDHRSPAPAVTPAPAPGVDVCLLVEGTYPYVPGGVSSWVHDIILGHPERRFSVVNIGSHPGAYGEPRFQMPKNVIALHRLFCQDGLPAALDGPARNELAEQIRGARARADARTTPSRMLSAFRRMHLDEEVSSELIDDLGSADLSISELLHGRAAFELFSEMAERLAPEAPFLDLFWHFRAMHVPMLRVLATDPAPAACYHAVSTGYAGLVGAVWSRLTGRPLMITEHGIYSRERDMELARADWIQDHHPSLPGDGAGTTWAPRVSPLRRVWSRFFRTLSRIGYLQARRLVTLSEVNRRKQMADGAPADKIEIVPNGVVLRGSPISADGVDGVVTAGRGATGSPGDGQSWDEGVIPIRPAKLRVGFVGRVVPIKDVVTFIKACDLALRTVDMDVRIIGPVEEDPGYVARCQSLVDRLGRHDQIRFLGPKKPAEIYGDLDVVALTSFSEGQPLVMLEAYAAELPVIASDVGACREMIEGRTEEDRALGPSGIVCPVASPKHTAAALIAMAQDTRARRRMGRAGRRRVTAFYQRRTMLASYRALYAALVTS
jgi:glycosyltransferase involved in cell wall biosynthesis